MVGFSVGRRCKEITQAFKDPVCGLPSVHSDPVLNLIFHQIHSPRLPDLITLKKRILIIRSFDNLTHHTVQMRKKLLEYLLLFTAFLPEMTKENVRK